MRLKMGLDTGSVVFENSQQDYQRLLKKGEIEENVSASKNKEEKTLLPWALLW